MTYQDFLKAVENLGEKWTLLDGGEIRMASWKSCCPWLVVRENNGEQDFSVEGGDYRIWNAADKCGRYSKKVRRDLLKACGLVKEV